MFISCLFGKMFSRLAELCRRKDSWAGLGLLVSIDTMPAGKETIISPHSFTWHLEPTKVTNDAPIFQSDPKVSNKLTSPR